MKRIKNAQRRLSVERLELRRLLASDVTLVRDTNTTPLVGPVVDAISATSVLNNIGYFTSNNATSGRELWRTDGTAEGTFLLADIAAGPNSSNPYGLTQLGNQLFFAASSNEYGTELWVTDGTSAGTRQVADLIPGSNSSSPSSFITQGDSVYFTAYTGSAGSVVWKSDGITTEQVGDSDGNYPTARPVRVGNYVLFNRYDASPRAVAIDSLTDNEQTLGIPPISDSTREISNKVLLSTFEAGTQLWLSDGTATGTTAVELPSISSSLSLTLSGTVGGRWLVLQNVNSSSIMWSIDPSGSFEAVITLPNFESMTVSQEFSGKVVISTSQGAFISGGTATSTASLENGSSLYLNIATEGQAVLNDDVFFSGFAPSTGQWSIWKLNTTSPSLTQVGGELGAGSAPMIVSVPSSGVYWSTNAGGFDYSLFRSTDGTNVEPILFNWFSIQSLNLLNDQLLFAGINEQGVSLRSYDASGLTNLTSPIALPTSDGLLGGAAAKLGDIQLFQVFIGTQSEWWRTDGTSEGTFKLIDTGSDGLLFASGASKVYALRGSNEIWNSDGSVSGTQPLLTLPGTDTGSWIVALSDRFIVGGTNGVWLSDGTEAGTVYTLLDGIEQFASPSGAIVSGGKAYFTSSGNFRSDGLRNDIVWSSDGTLAGTIKVAEEPYLRWDVAAAEGNTIVFSDQRGAGNLWRTDDAFATVQLVARRQPTDTSIRTIGIAGGAIYYSRSNSPDVDIYRVSGNPDRPALLTTLSVDLSNYQLSERFITLAGKMYVRAFVNGEWTVLTDGLGDGSLQTDTTLQNIGPLGSSYGEGQNFILGSAYFPEFGIELGRLERDAEVTISKRYFNENSPVGSVVGQLDLQWSDDSATQFSLVDGDGSDQNSLFSIDANGRLLINGILDYEQSPVATVRVRASNSQAVVESRLVLFLGDLKDSVENIAIANNSIDENAAAGTVVGTLTSTPPVAGTPVSYSLLAVDGLSTDMAFAISGNQLIATRPLDFESQRSYTVTVKAVDLNGFEGITTLTVNVRNLNENPNALISLSNDQVAEGNSEPVVVGSLAVPGSTDSSWTFTLSSGPGDVDNQLFTIDGDQLIVTDLVDYEVRDNYSVHITASSPQGGSVSAFLTIDITPVDEFPPLFINVDYLQGAIFENTPAGTAVLKLSVFDQDRGENYQYSGSITFSPIDGVATSHFEIVGDQFVVTEPFNFENVSPNSGVIFVTATSSNGASVSAYRGEGVSFGTFLADANDPPEISVPVPDQIALAGEQLDVDLGFEDEDVNDILTYSATVNGSALPSWVSIQNGTITFNPTAANVGTYSVAVTATDSRGASVTDTFSLAVLVPTILNGTGGNDAFTVTTTATNQSTVRRNGQIVFQGNLTTNAVLIEGGLGTDQIIVSGTGGVNNFEVAESFLRVDGGYIFVRNMEARQVRGLGGGDTFNVNIRPVTTNRASVLTPGTSILGGAGADKVVATGVGDNDWVLTGRDAGSLNGVTFQSIRNIVGSSNDDSFTILRGGSLSGTIDGAGGADQIVYASPATSVDVFVDQASVSASSVGAVLNIEGFSTSNPSRATVHSVSGAATWSISADQVRLRDMLFVGFGNLEGSNFASDRFEFRFIGDAVYSIDGGRGGSSPDTIYFAPEAGFANINLETSSGSGISNFTGIEQFVSDVYSSTLTGPRANTTWTIGDNYTTSLSSGVTVVGFRELFGNARNDSFVFTPDSFNGFTRFPDAMISGSAGSDSILIESFGNADWYLDQPGGGRLQANRFSGIENLLSHAFVNNFNFTDVPATPWFESIEGSSGANTLNSLGYSGSQSNQTAVVDLQNATASGVVSFRNLNRFDAGGFASVLRGPNLDLTWRLEDIVTFEAGGRTIINFTSIVGGSANDVVVVAAGGGAIRFDGGAGRNTLDYNESVAAQVDLAAGTASQFAEGVINFQDVFGSPGNDLLFGNGQNNLLVGGDGDDIIDGRGGNDSLFGQAGNDILTGGLGNDLMVGGSGADQLFGGVGSDLLIADLVSIFSGQTPSGVGSISRDRVDAVMAVWSSNQSYANRVNQLTQGIGFRNSIRLDATTVQADTSIDVVSGGDADDWFLVGGIDTLVDRLARERLLRV